MGILAYSGQTNQFLNEIKIIFGKNANMDHTVFQFVMAFLATSGNTASFTDLLNFHQQYAKAAHQSTVVLSDDGNALFRYGECVLFSCSQNGNFFLANAKSKFRAPLEYQVRRTETKAAPEFFCGIILHIDVACCGDTSAENIIVHNGFLYFFVFLYSFLRMPG